jgi:subtilisin-like proprotein convertase family protein
MAGVAGAQTFSNTTSITIPNSGAALGAASPYPSSVTVSGAGPQLTGISVRLNNFSHPYPADVDVLLVGPNGQNVMLMSDVGTYFPVSNLTFTFNNVSGTSMPSNGQLTSGMFAPTNFDPTGDVDGFPAPAPLVGPYGASFASVIGTNPNGSWKLYVVDDVAGNSGQFAGGWSITITAVTPALQLTGAVSRKTHPGAGGFDVNLPLAGPHGVECRSGAAGHTLVFTFTNNVVSGNASVTGGVGNVSGSPTFAGKTMRVNLTGVINAQTLTVTLSGVTDSFNQMLPNTAVSANFLLADTTANNSVNASDISQVKTQAGAPLSASNFRSDLTVSGAINASDIAQAKANSGNGISGASVRPGKILFPR